MFKSVYTKRSKCSMFKAFEKIISLIINKSDADDDFKCLSILSCL
jgi:hypothetical protein